MEPSVEEIFSALDPKSQTMRVTLKDIAERTGLALSTISMALNDHPHINLDTKKLVRKLAEDMNYRPHPAARALARKKTSLIGLVIQNVMSSFYPEIIQGVEDIVLENSLSTILCNTNEQATKEVDYLSRLLDKRADGIILEPHNSQQDRDLIEQIQRNGIPLITILRRYPGLDFPYVVVDNESGGYVATRYLIDRGHRKVGHLEGPLNADTSEPRKRGYYRALREAGIEPGPEWTTPAQFNPASGAEAMVRLLEQFPGMTAVFAASDSVAMGALGELQRRGIKVPQDMAIVGFDGLFFGQIVEPRLTTVSQPRYEIGELSARMLLERMERKSVESITLQPQLIIGASA